MNPKQMPQPLWKQHRCDGPNLLPQLRVMLTAELIIMAPGNTARARRIVLCHGSCRATHFGTKKGTVLASWSHLKEPEAVLRLCDNREESEAILSHLGIHLGLSEMLLELTWAILDTLITCPPPCPSPEEGVGGRG